MFGLTCFIIFKTDSVDDKLDRFNMLSEMEEKPKKNYQSKTNQLRDLHTEVRDGFDRLNIIAAKGPNSREFIDPQVQNLWAIAVTSNFTNDELESLKVKFFSYLNTVRIEIRTPTCY